MKTLPLIVAMAAIALGSMLGGCHHTARPAEQSPDIRNAILVSMQTTRGEIVLALDHVRAPVSVDNFLMHAERAITTARSSIASIPKFVIQGGGFTRLLQERAKIDEAAGGKDPTIVNEWTNGLKNTRGTIAMARDAAPDTATREFYINVADNPRLDTAREKNRERGVCRVRARG